MRPSCICLFAISVVLLSGIAFSAEPTAEQKQAVFMINYAQYATYRLKTYNNILVLEEEYKNLKDNMNFQTIQDADTVDTINNLLEALHFERKIHKQRERLEASIERKLSQALYNSAPQFVGIVTGVSDPVSLSIEIARTAGNIFFSYQQYKNQLSEEFDEKMFQYQQLSENNLNMLYKDLNTYTYDLMKQYNISDEWRLNEHELEEMFRYLKDENIQRRYTNLKNMETAVNTGRYVQHFPMFWYYLAKAAFDAGKDEEAIKYYAKFEAENINIFRYDTWAVDAYKGKIAILIKNPQQNRSEIVRKLLFIEQNKTTWKDYYFCALVYDKLGDVLSAQRLLDKNISELSAIVDNQFLDVGYLTDLYKVGEYYGNGAYDGLELSRSLSKSIGNSDLVIQSIEEQYKNDSASFSESLYWFGVQSAYSLVEGAKANLKRIELSTKVHSEKKIQVDCSVPIQWVLSTSATVSAVFVQPDGKEIIYDMHIDEKSAKRLRKRSVAECVLPYTTGKVVNDWKKQQLAFKCLRINHPLYPIEISYPIGIILSKPVKNLVPIRITFRGRNYVL